MMPLPTRWSEDRQPARSRLLKHWVHPTQLMWELEVRTEDMGAGTVRLGELILMGSMDSELTLSISEWE